LASIRSRYPSSTRGAVVQVEHKPGGQRATAGRSVFYSKLAANSRLQKLVLQFREHAAERRSKSSAVRRIWLPILSFTRDRSGTYLMTLLRCRTPLLSGWRCTLLTGAPTPNAIGYAESGQL